MFAITTETNGNNSNSSNTGTDISTQPCTGCKSAMLAASVQRAMRMRHFAAVLQLVLLALLIIWMVKLIGKA